MKNAYIHWNKPKTLVLEDKGLNDRTLKFAAMELRRQYDKFVPMLRGGSLGLAGNVKTYVEDGRGVIHYMTPYAHFQYEGRLMIDPVTKSPIARKNTAKVYAKPTVPLEYTKSEHDRATAKWDRVANPVIKSAYTRAVQEYIERG